jgi:hypothetical protein
MDPETTKLVIGALGVTEFLRRVAGPAADEVGEWGRDKIRAFRLRNLERAAQRAAEQLSVEGVEPSEVPLRTLLPIFEGASREDDEDLSLLWANLLANAASPDPGHVVLPIFPHLLSQFSPIDAKLLDVLDRIEAGELADQPTGYSDPRVRPDDVPPWGVDAGRLALLCGLDAERVSVSLDTLFALALIHDTPYPNDDEDVAYYLGDGRVAITALGRRFVKVCRRRVA